VAWPLPLPLAPPVTVIHEVLLAAVQAHPFAAVTATLAVPALGPSVALTGDRAKLQAIPS
jgi:hypothetical protein